MDAFAGLAIAWCFGEDLINFYWSSWTLIDLGSVIAMLGTVLQQWYSLSSEGIQQPAWNFALGTPIVCVTFFRIQSSDNKGCRGVMKCSSYSSGLPAIHSILRKTLADVRNSRLWPLLCTVWGLKQKGHGSHIRIRGKKEGLERGYQRQVEG